MSVYIVKDWAGNTMNWKGNPFDDVEDAQDALFEHVAEQTNVELIEGTTEYSNMNYDDLYDINLGEYQIIEKEQP